MSNRGDGALDVVGGRGGDVGKNFVRVVEATYCVSKVFVNELQVVLRLN